MKNSIINNILKKIGVKKGKKINDYDYVFTEDELDILNKQNNEKIKLLRKNVSDFNKTQKKTEDTSTNDTKTMEKEEIITEEEQKEIEEEIEKIIESHKEEVKISYINLSKEMQDEIYESWKKITASEVDKDIQDGKEILNHNYTIYYYDEAAKFVHMIRLKYETVINYLIGFNNEKKGIMEKTIFSDNVDNEWKFLKQYISILEKIRSFLK